MTSKEFFKKNKKIASFVLAGLAILAVFFVWAQTRFSPVGSSPKAKIVLSRLPEKIKLGESYPVAMRLVNQGGDSLKEAAAFSGWHIEVANAKVKNIRAFSPFSGSRVVVKPIAQQGNVYWFEATYDFLAKDQWGMVLFDIIPDNPEQPSVKIWYRAWLPAACSLTDRFSAANDLVGKYKSFWQGWRNENCLVREPANDNQAEGNCQISVYAAHAELQELRCFKKEMTRE